MLNRTLMHQPTKPAQPLLSRTFTPSFKYHNLSIAMSALKKDVWALDFDGVLCDSVGESSLSAFKACEKVFPAEFCS